MWVIAYMSAASDGFDAGQHDMFRFLSLARSPEKAAFFTQGPLFPASAEGDSEVSNGERLSTFRAVGRTMVFGDLDHGKRKGPAGLPPGLGKPEPYRLGGGSRYWTVLLAIGESSLSRPDVLYAVTVKYHVPVPRFSMRWLATPGEATFAIFVRVVGEVP
jgi:hypothetical protein